MWATIRSNTLAGFVLLSVALGAGVASAQTADPNEGRVTPAPVMGEEEQAIILDAIEEYFDSVSTLQARFRQLNMDGSIFTGDIKIQRPGKMRIDYDDPVPFLIVADGNFYIFVDQELEQASHIPIGLTPADILLRQPMELGDEVLVDDAVRKDGFLFVTLAQKEAPDAGTLTLTFQEDPMTLLQWVVIDAQGILTRVILDDPVKGVTFDDDLFYFVNPWPNRRD